MQTTIKHGHHPFQTALLHGGPGASGEMGPVARELSHDLGVLELIQTEKSVNGQIEELHKQLTSCADLPVVLVGFSWGAWLGFLFAARYPELVKKLILISAGAFESQYNKDLMRIRLNRLNNQDRKEAERLMAFIRAGRGDNAILGRFGKLMTIADSFDPDPHESKPVVPDMKIYQSIEPEASALRETGQLIRCADRIKCPGVAIHGDYDPHPAEGVEKPLTERLHDFKMIHLKKCGHVPWKER
ncbi:MAG: alpha/beta hydrolase, partial [Marinilabilia sp.]